MAVTRKDKIARYLLIAALAYLILYLVFRETNQEIWLENKQSYVIFPDGIGKLLYYFWRPLTYIDGTLTGMQFHIEPHH